MVNNTPISATDEGIEDIKWTFIRTRKPKKKNINRVGGGG